MAVNPIIAALLGGTKDNDAKKYATPGINGPVSGLPGVDPGIQELLAQNPPEREGFGGFVDKVGGAASKVGDFINTPGGGFVMNLLAQQGYSPVPQSKLGAVGRAGVATAQQQQQKQLIEARLGMQKNTAAPSSVREWEYYNSLSEKDQKRYLQMKRDTLSVSNIGNVPNIVDEIDASATPLGTIEGEASGAASVSGAEEAARQASITDAIPDQVSARIAATDRAKSRISVPEDIATDEPLIEQGEGFIRALESGGLSTGPIRGQAPAFTTQEQLFEAYSGQQLLDQISSVTLGALSKGEMDFLKTTVTDRTNTEEANIEIIKQKNDIMLRAAKRGRKKVGIDSPSDKSKPVSEMTKEEIEAELNAN